MIRPNLTSLLAGALVLAGLGASGAAAQSSEKAPARELPPGTVDPGLPGEQPPPGVDRIVPRGFLPPINDPVFVPATDAGMPDTAMVLGVEMNGEARAYSLTLLNHHEVVNDTFGDRPVAAVW